MLSDNYVDFYIILMLIKITFLTWLSLSHQIMESTDKISITTKTLASGNCQVKFFVEDEHQPQYGYLLVTEPKPVGDIIEEIKNRLERRRMETMNLNPFFPVLPTPEDHHFHLFSA